MKKQNIVLTGGLGYLGSELCTLLSGEARYKNIIVLDNRFISERVAQLRNWGIEFIQGDILDKDLLQRVLHDADYVYHLAGKTDVAYTATQSNPEQDQLITDVGVTGTRNVLSAISATCKLIFPSTHVVFEGLTETTFDIPEILAPRTILSYANGKATSERDIALGQYVNDITAMIGHDNHIIVRLGSVYGYSTDTMRIGIMPNLFSKIASQNGTISLFGGGVQYKSLVNVIDVVRAMKFLAESEHIGTYHLSNENMTVREVAEICKSINPQVTLTETTDEIPNKGYTLSNQKLLSTGFKFLYNIHDSIRDMITKWSYRSTDTELEYLQKGGNEYIDSRGIIRNYELTEPINLIGWIESRTGTIRANHYHPIQEQKCLLIKGRYISVTQDLSYPNAPIEHKLIRPGDIAVIRPNVAHTMVFLQDSLFLNLVRGEREHENYGITHTIYHPLVTEENKYKYMDIYRTTCRACGHTELLPAISLGMSPLANNLVDNPDTPVDMYPLDMEWCPQCYNCQLTCVVPAYKLFDNYLYVSSTSAIFRKHFELAADQYIREFGLTDKSLVLDIGSNDGVFLKPLQQRGVRVVGVEPAANIATLANSDNIPTIHGYFNAETAQRVYTEYGSPDIITAFNVFAHADDLEGIAKTVFSLLQPNGVFIIEVQYLMDTIRDLTFDNIYHEHVNYWCVSSLNNFFTRLGFSLFHVEHIDTHGGSIRCYISRDRQPDSTVMEFCNQEGKQGIHDYGTFQLFAKRVSDIRDTVRKNLDLLKQKYSVICGYGSPAKATTALNYFGITSTDIQYTIEDNELKCGKYIPGTRIRIGNHSYGSNKAPDICVVLAWNFFDSIVQKHQYMIDAGTKFISIKDLEIPDSMPIMDTNVLDIHGEQVTGQVYDCFLFFNELDLLELRLNVLDPVVDHFVIVEANVTHSGKPRDFCFQQYQHDHRFAKFSSKIIYVQVDDIPVNFQRLSVIEQPQDYQQEISNQITHYMNQWNHMDNLPAAREQYQRASILRALEHCKYEDIIMLSDIDEITNPDTLGHLLQNFDDSRVYGMRQNSYYYKLNLLREKHWVGARITTYKRFCSMSPITFRHIRDCIVSNGGWHFSFQGTLTQVYTKLTSYSHCDMATDEVLDKLIERIEQGIDPYNRGRLNKVQIDDTYPQYLLDNIDHYKHMIL